MALAALLRVRTVSVLDACEGLLGLEQVGQLVEQVGDVLDQLAESQQRCDVRAPVRVDFVNPRAREMIETLTK